MVTSASLSASFNSRAAELISMNFDTNKMQLEAIPKLTLGNVLQSLYSRLADKRISEVQVLPMLLNCGSHDNYNNQFCTYDPRHQ